MSIVEAYPAFISKPAHHHAEQRECPAVAALRRLAGRWPAQKQFLWETNVGAGLPISTLRDLIAGGDGSREWKESRER
jgi:hypothetical protein